MGQPRPAYNNRGPVEVTSISTAITFSPPIVWVHIDSAGSGGLTVKTEDGVSHAYTSLPAGRVLMGPFAELTSMTCSKISYGDGPPPTSTLANVAPGTTGALGSVKLSVTPVSGASPIAVGSNDARVTTVEVPLPLGTDCSLVESTVWTAPVACTVTAAYVETGSKAISASNSNYITITLNQRPLSGPGTAAAMVATTTKAADLNATVAWTDKSLGTLANTSLLAGDKVTFTSATTGTITGGVPGFLRITYTVP